VRRRRRGGGVMGGGDGRTEEGARATEEKSPRNQRIKR
jgi:hypothetical protein